MRCVKIAGVVLVTFAVGFLAWEASNFLFSGLGGVVEEWEASNQTFKLRVERRPELHTLRYHYIFQARPDESGPWVEILSHVQDDPDPIPRAQVRFVGDTIGYFFIGPRYAVTTDGGRTWSVFDVKKDSSFGRDNPGRSWIDNVRVTADGNGVMTLRPYDGPRENAPKFYTSDFGCHWSETQNR